MKWGLVVNLHALKLFRQVVDAGSVSAAAARVHLSQPAVTIQLRKLEQELGFAITRPQGRGIALTEAGAWLSEQAERLFRLEAEIEAGCEDVRIGRRGLLKIAATYLPANFLLPDWIADFRMDHPDVSIHLTSGNARDVLVKLMKYEADIVWIGGQHRFPATINAKPCYEDEMWFVVAPDHHMAGARYPLREVVREAFVMREPGSFTRDALSALCRAEGLPPPFASLISEGPQESIRAAIAGVGVAYAAKMEVAAYVDEGVLKRVETDVPPVRNPISCCTRANDPLSPAASAFLHRIGLAEEHSLKI
ncbi:LysR family transcriptional regulator [Paenibacillus sp. TRM 82003]|nr:LysR family transcriptional regulator [Paenibacillus sp. TRM 82003]